MCKGPEDSGRTAPRSALLKTPGAPHCKTNLQSDHGLSDCSTPETPQIRCPQAWEMRGAAVCLVGKTFTCTGGGSQWAWAQEQGVGGASSQETHMSLRRVQDTRGQRGGVLTPKQRESARNTMPFLMPLPPSAWRATGRGLCPKPFYCVERISWLISDPAF